MSRIFDALQQSKSEGDGFEFPLISSLAAEVPPAAEMTEAIGRAKFPILRYRSTWRSSGRGNFAIAG